MSAIDAVADLFQAGDLQKLGPAIEAAAAAAGQPLNEVIYDVYLALHRRGDRGAAMNFVLSFCHSQPDASERIRYFGLRIHDESDRDVGANLLMGLVSNGQADRRCFEVCVAYCVDKDLTDHALSIFQRYQDDLGRDAMSTATLFNIGSILLMRRQFDDAFDLYQAALKLDPGFAPAHANLLHLARGEGHAAAVAFIDQLSADIATAAPYAEPADDQPQVVVWRGGETRAIEAAIRAHGFCLLRDACDVETVAALLVHAEALHDGGVQFPIPFTEEVKQALPRLFRFDPAPIFQALSGTGFAIDHPVSVMRRVAVDKGASLVPFHQDSTAFQRALYNIWTPLTPAGGDYPSIQFVAKLINTAEQTKISEGEYNRIEIDADFVTAKYGDLIRTVNDAAPGDCVIFYGTTIHRSFGLQTALRPRYNIEVRWS